MSTLELVVRVPLRARASPLLERAVAGLELLAHRAGRLRRRENGGSPARRPQAKKVARDIAAGDAVKLTHYRSRDDVPTHFD